MLLYNTDPVLTIQPQNDFSQVNECSERVVKAEMEIDKLMEFYFNITDHEQPEALDLSEKPIFEPLGSLILDLKPNIIDLALEYEEMVDPSLESLYQTLQNWSEKTFYGLLDSRPDLQSLDLDCFTGIKFPDNGKAYPHITSISFDLRNFDGSLLVWLSKSCPNLETLDLIGFSCEKLSDNDIVAYPNIRSVTIHADGCRNTGALLWLKRTCPNLQHLVFKGDIRENIVKIWHEDINFLNVNHVQVELESFTGDTVIWLYIYFLGLEKITVQSENPPPQPERAKVRAVLDVLDALGWLPGVEQLRHLVILGHEFLISPGAGSFIDRIYEYHTAQVCQNEQEDLCSFVKTFKFLKRFSFSGQLRPERNVPMPLDQDRFTIQYLAELMTKIERMGFRSQNLFFEDKSSTSILHGPYTYSSFSVLYETIAWSPI